MIILDTNIVSELMRLAPEPVVLDWFAQHQNDDLYLTAISEAELRTGVAIMPPGKRRDQIHAAISLMIAEDFACRILPFDSPAARCYAEIASARRAMGRPILEADCQIAAIAQAYGATVATRNVRDFEGCGIEIDNPFDNSAKGK